MLSGDTERRAVLQAPGCGGAAALTAGAADKALGVVEAVEGLAGIALPIDAFVALDTGT